ncbi:MAG: MFS transporter [Alphaproteobacteria bacterium]
MVYLPVPPHSRLRTDWLPGMMYGAYMMITSVTVFFLPVFFNEQLGFSGGQIGLLYAIQAVAGVVAAFPAGLGNDRITSRTIVAVSLILQSIALIMMARVRFFAPYMLIFFFWTLTNSTFRLSLDVQVLKTDEGTRTGSRIGLYQTLRFAGVGLGTIAAGYLLNILDFETTLIAVALTCIVLAGFAVFLAPTPVGKIRLADYKADFFNTKVLLFAGWLFLFTTHWGAEQTCYGLFLRKNFQLDLIQMGLYMCVEFFAIALTILFFARKMNDPQSTFRFAVFGLVTSGAGHIGMVFPPVALSLAFRALHGIGDGVIMIILYVGVSRLFDIKRLGGNAGLINLAMMMGMVVGALISSPIGEKFSYAIPLWVSGVITLLLIAPILVNRRRKAGAAA